MSHAKTFEELVSEAEQQPFSGWNFSWIDGRYVQGKVYWDYRAMVLKMLPKARSLLDLGTGGGEFIASLGILPPIVCATEGYPPNAKIALSNLGPLGADVIENLCDDNGSSPHRGALPFRDETFDLVIDRHESYAPDEVHRVLKTSGRFLTQQVGSENNAELRRFFHVQNRSARWDLKAAERELTASGFDILEKGEASVRSRFLDVGALVYYLKAIPWEVPGFTMTRFERELRSAHDVIGVRGGLDVTTTRFYVLASRGRSMR
jgi:SAM-dependent methyltransferase